MVHSKRRNRLHQRRMNDLVFVMYNLKLRQRHKNRQAIMNPLCLDDVPSDDEWITEREKPTLPREGNWLSVLDRNARHGCHSEDEEVDALARDLEQACHDHIGENVGEIHEVSDDDDMDDNMNAPRDFDHDFDDATIGDDDIEELGDTVGDDEDEGDNKINNVVDCGNDDFGDEDDDLF
ncbi:prostatic spermine-binding protein-like [Camellia sinensis]|uniref:prostatic spermine-binding protein-like n=1 Tax=Camellia sinensis TaxID=4442 RepID=UPI001036BD56|nr:prostatic spermine-binding protein-like [Camellia sinensis]